MHVILEGKDKSGRVGVTKWFIVALNGDGPYIPAVPAVVLAKRIIAAAKPIPSGATPCVGLITLDEYLGELKNLDIKTYEFEE